VRFTVLLHNLEAFFALRHDSCLSFLRTYLGNKIKYYISFSRILKQMFKIRQKNLSADKNDNNSVAVHIECHFMSAQWENTAS